MPSYLIFMLKSKSTNAASLFDTFFYDYVEIANRWDLRAWIINPSLNNAVQCETILSDFVTQFSVDFLR